MRIGLARGISRGSSNEESHEKWNGNAFSLGYLWVALKLHLRCMDSSFAMLGSLSYGLKFRVYLGFRALGLSRFLQDSYSPSHPIYLRLMLG